MAEVPIPLQSDTITQIPGGGVRAITAIVLLNGVPTPVSMQVISLSDATGAVLQDINTLTDPMEGVISELRDCKRLLAMIAGIPDFIVADDQENSLNPKR